MRIVIDIETDMKASEIWCAVTKDIDTGEVKVERREFSRLEDLHAPLLRLPFLSGGIDLASLYELSTDLTDQGVR